MLSDLEKALKGATKDWAAAKKRSDRDDRIRRSDWRRLQRSTTARLTLKDAAWSVMAEAYMLASADNTLPANARQIMYAARPRVLAMTGGECWSKSSYFTQILLPDFVEAYPSITADWDVVFDARGHIHEPHTGHMVELGTLQVRRYLNEWADGASYGDLVFEFKAKTRGPADRYKSVVFLEKEGFNQLVDRARIRERYDVGIMSTKGMSVTAARSLVEALSAAGVMIYVVRDFDKSGFSIVSTLSNDTRRYTFDSIPNVADLGLRIADVTEMGLDSEECEYRGDPRRNLRRNGATAEEIDFLVSGGIGRRWRGQRVELNAMTSDQFVAWLEDKLEEHGVVKTVPDDDTLIAGYREAIRVAEVNKAVEGLLPEIDERVDAAAVPDDIAERVRTALDGEPSLSWDQAVGQIVDERTTDDGATP